MNVQDNSGTVKVAMLNPTVEHFLDTSANKIINMMCLGDQSIPEQLNALLGNQFLFRLRLSPYQNCSESQYYTVAAIALSNESLEIDYETTVSSKVMALH